MIPTLFDFEGASVRVTQKDGDVWFIARDVAALLGYANPLKAIRDHCKGVNEMVTPSTGGDQVFKIIPERDVYRLIMRSNLPAAERFEEWVVGTVLPTIRRTGQFSVVPTPAPPAFPVPATMAEALRLAADTMDRLEEAKAELADAAPKLLTYERCMSSDSLFGFREVAAILAQKGIGSTNLVRRLEEKGVLYHEQRGKKKGHVMAKAEYIHRGYFKAIERAYEVMEVGNIPTGEHRVSATLKVTTAGIEFIAKILVERREA